MIQLSKTMAKEKDKETPKKEDEVNPKQKKYTFSQWQGYVNNIVLMLPLIWKMIRREKYFYKVL